ncbi:TraB/GumN family protein [Saccharicrinis sp. GN24d3]|uniref:TraB/GumN family protein n=1 Tax=Saccharicrinis sp. GN24d3 TaxID=3458416 RepID=UPI0040351E74
MKSFLFSTALCLFVFLATNAQESSLLWRISGNGLSEPSYIYGTIHLICPQDYSMKSKVKACFAETQQVYLEVDFDDPQMMQKMMSMSMLTNGETARDYLTDEEYAYLDDKFKNTIGTGMAQLQVMKPLILLSMSYISILQCQPVSFETVFVEMAKEDDKEVLGLETLEQQMSFFNEIPLTEQFKMVSDIVKQEDKARDEFNTLVKIYNSENIKGLLEFMDESEWSMEKYEEILIHGRNKDWASKLDSIAKEKPTFFAVGAGHLAGENGWLSLLEKKGYNVEAVK